MSALKKSTKEFTNNIKVTVIIPVYNQEKLVIRALESIPERNDIEIIVVDDGSDDNTWNMLLKYRDDTLNKKNIILLYNKENKGVAYTINKGYDNANGEYIVLLGSDDYFYPKEFEQMFDKFDGTDVIFFQTTNNYGLVELNEHNKCGSFKFVRRDFMKDLRNDEFRIAGEDYYLWKKMLAKKPTIKEYGLIVKHYNYPREGSLNWDINMGIIDLESGLRK